MSECNKAAGSNWMQNWRKYGATDLVTGNDPDKSASIVMHLLYLTGEWHARKISNHLSIPVQQIGIKWGHVMNNIM